MEKLKKFFTSPLGLVVLVLLVITVVVAYSSKIPGFGFLQKLASKLPGADGKTAAA